MFVIFQVWYLLLASLVLTAFVLYVVSRLILKSSDQPPRAFEQFSAAIQYVVAAVVESGNSPCTGRKMLFSYYLMLPF